VSCLLRLKVADSCCDVYLYIICYFHTRRTAESTIATTNSSFTHLLANQLLQTNVDSLPSSTLQEEKRL